MRRHFIKNFFEKHSFQPIFLILWTSEQHLFAQNTSFLGLLVSKQWFMWLTRHDILYSNIWIFGWNLAYLVDNIWKFVSIVFERALVCSTSIPWQIQFLSKSSQVQLTYVHRSVQIKGEGNPDISGHYPSDICACCLHVTIGTLFKVR